MATVVLVPGACHGGWWFEPLARRLTLLMEGRLMCLKEAPEGAE